MPPNHRNPRRTPACAPTPLRGPIRKAISGYRYYSPELGRWISRDPIGEWGGIHPFSFAYNNPLVFVDPVGLKTFIEVGDQKIILHMLLRYVAADGSTFTVRELGELAAKHKVWAEELFGSYIYGGENAPRVKETVSRVVGADESGLIYRDVDVDLGPRYKGYAIELNVITTFTPEPSKGSESLASPYTTFEIHQERIHASARRLSRHSTMRTVFHEYMHHLNLLDEYDRPGYAYNYREVFHTNWENYPEDDAVMTGGGTTIYDRYIEAALFKIHNLERRCIKGDTLLDRVFYLNPNDHYFIQHPEMFNQVLLIIR